MSFDPIAFLQEAMRIDSTTGHEGPFAAWVAERLAELGLPAELSAVAGASLEDRANVWSRPEATGDAALPLVLCTHLDTVPPFIPPGAEEDRITGRGSCDAKGQIAVMIAAALELRRRGAPEPGLLFVAGEENDHKGAASVRDAGLAGLGLSAPPGLIVIGEPTVCRFVRAQKGIMPLTVEATGKAAHSAYPERGESATEKLLDALEGLRAAVRALPVDDELGPTTANIGIIEGGVAPNVIPASARAVVLLRTTSPSETIIAALEAAVGASATVRVDRHRMSDPLRFVLPAGAHGEPEEPVVGFNTDGPYLAPLGSPMALYGAGDIKVAHGKDEHVPRDEVTRAIDVLVRVGEAAAGRAS